MAEGCSLPTEIIAHIIQFLPPRELVAEWRDLSQSESLWKRHVEDAFSCARLSKQQSYQSYFQERSKVKSNRIAITTNDQLLTCLPDGSDKKVLLDSDEFKFQQPTWGPTGTLAVTQYKRRPATVAVYNAQGELLHNIETSSVPFYIYWSPCGTRLSLLGSNGMGVVLSCIDLLADRPKEVVLNDARPYFYSWSPDNRGLFLCHRDSSVLDLLNPEDRKIKQIQRYPVYGRQMWMAPFWLSNKEGGSDLFYCNMGAKEGREHINLNIGHFLDSSCLDKTGKELREILRDNGVDVSSCVETNDYKELMREKMERGDVLVEKKTLRSWEGGNITFIPSPDGEKIAITSEMDQDSIDIVGRGGEIVCTVGGSHSIIGFFWSPDSNVLLFIEHRSRELRWCVYNVREKREYSLSAFTPTRVLLEHYLPFMAQYAQNITFFSPDSKYFVYTCARKNDTLVHPVEEGSAPLSLGHEGQFATWSRM
ncbi:hypothetical protein PROFUN_01935 [Planoprotostelium fungivorum]|uniref:F-box domain-containing protein n=1 Tax=Planoprotostelium fungivorum TaxID=1890364 RepID=A0A2P6NZ32_9EUKA|nr:hypothetical protein PROFUN_01935 [Planoprotostelium fungivorum]